MNETEFRDKAEKLVRNALPKKRHVDSCVELLWRGRNLRAFDHKSAVSTERLSRGIHSARTHLSDMASKHLVHRLSKEPIRFYLDSSNPITPFIRGGSLAIRTAKARNLSELQRHMAADSRVTQVALAAVSATDENELVQKIEDDDRFNNVVEAISASGLTDKQYLYGKRGWRRGSYLWYLGEAVLAMLSP